MENIYTNQLRKLVEEIPNTSAWKRGVKEYTDEFLDNLEEKSQLNGRLPKDEKELKEWLLNGAYRSGASKGNCRVCGCDF